MKLFPGVPPYQRWMMGATFVVVTVYSIAQNKASLVEASQTQLSSPSPRIIDGDTVDFSNGRVRIVGMTICRSSRCWRARPCVSWPPAMAG